MDKYIEAVSGQIPEEYRDIYDYLRQELNRCPELSVLSANIISEAVLNSIIAVRSHQPE